MQRLPRLQRSSHGLYSRRSWRFLIYRPIQTRLKYMRYLLLSQRVIEIKTQRQASIQSRVPPLGCPISPWRSVSQRSGGIYSHAIVKGTATSFLFTGPIHLRDFTTTRKYHTCSWRWQTTTFVFYIIAIYSNMEGVITLTLIMMKKWRSDWIKADASLMKERYARQLT